MVWKLTLRFTFIGLIAFVFLAAHWLKDDLYEKAEFIGVDIPMTPFTTDMTLMVSKDEAYYTKSFEVFYQNQSGTQLIKAENLGWYEFKAAFQWWSECQENNFPCPMVINYLCRSLDDYTKSTVFSWRAEGPFSKAASTKGGFGVEYSCPAK